jgi:transcriptional regulator with XRE-family HTH domain
MINISQQIIKARKNCHLTQEQVAKAIEMSRPVYIAIENGKREPTSGELARLSALFNVPVAEFFDEPRNNEKFKQMYFYILSLFKDGIPKTKLAKLLYLADFRNYYEELESMSGVRYVRRTYGPVADIFFELTNELDDAGQIDIEIRDNNHDTKTMLIKSRSRDVGNNLLSNNEKTKIREICNLWKERTTKEIVNFTHEQEPWASCRDGEYIPYSLIIQEDPDHVYQPIA